MGCASCGRATVTTKTYSPSFKKFNSIVAPVPEELCDYSLDQLRVWIGKLICCKDTGLYISLKISAPLMNKTLGNVKSALNYPTNICYFKKELDAASNILVLIENSGKC